MEPTIRKVSPFSVAGISVRTLNCDEASPTTARQPRLWGRFFSERIAGQVPGGVYRSPIYGVYSSYESDFAGPYTLTAGIQVLKPLEANGYAEIEIQGGDYLVFETKGPMPRTAIGVWAEIRTFFANSREFVRSYATDFEEYRGSNEVAIHIAIK